MVYVLNKNNQPLMPTDRHGKVRRLLKEKKAKVVKRTPFTIKLLFDTMDYVDVLTLGVDSGSKTIGISVSSKSKEYYSAEVTLRTDIVDLLSIKRQNRRTRRNRKTRYRKPRFENRVKGKQKGWLAPSIEHKIQTHLKSVEIVTQLLPVSKIIVETASFDIQKIQNPDITGTDYQNGDQLGFWNIREYVLFRDGHICQHCKGKSKDKVLNVHHIESRKTGGDAPGNLVTLCETCHNRYHTGKIQLKLKRTQSFRDATFMGIMRWSFYNRLKKRYSHLEVKNTYGYLTKNKRIQTGLEKAHAVDALCIAGNEYADRADNFYNIKKIRCHNRQIHKANILKGSRRKRNQAPYMVKGFRLFDYVEYEGQCAFISGRRSTGYFALKTLDGTFIHKCASYKKLLLLEKRQSYLIEKEDGNSFHHLCSA
jgi:hypothetical protein